MADYVYRGTVMDARIEYDERLANAPVKGWTTAKCGTAPGYESHRHYGVPVCGPCRIAKAQRSKDARARKKVA